MSDHITSYEVPEVWSDLTSVKELKYEFMEVIMTFILFFSTVAGFSYYSDGNVKAETGSLLVVLFPLAMTIARRKIKNIYMSILMHLLLLLIFFLLPIDASKHLLFIIYIIYALYLSIRKNFKFNRKFWGYSIFVFGQISLCISALIWSFKDDLFMFYTIVLMSALFAVLFIIYYSKSRIDRLIVLEKQYDYNSVNKVRSIYNKLITSILGVLIGTYVIVRSVVGSSIEKANHFLKIMFLGMLTSIIKYFGSVHVEQMMKKAQEQEKRTKLISFADLKPSPHDSRYNTIGDTVGIIITIVGVVIVAIYFYTLLRNFYFNFIKGTKIIFQNDNETVERIYLKDEKKDIKVIKKVLGVNLTEREKIRKKYKKIITKYKKRGVTTDLFDTSNDIKIKINNSTGDNIDRLTQIYQKVRYAKEEPTSNEIMEAKSFK